jgi:SAM-dependent methyltransferase
MKYTKVNGQIFNAWKEKYNLPWMKPISHEDFIKATRGEELLTLTPLRKVPFSWYGNCKGKKVLGLAAGGGQQMAILSALGAECTLLDISDEQIESDRLVSEREGYAITIIKGDMTEKLPFDDETFDLVINPVSNQYIEKVEPVFKEVARVLKKGGAFLAGLDNGLYWAFDEDTNQLAYRLPFNPLQDENIKKALLEEDMAYIFSHTLEEQLGGQLKAGLIIKELLEDLNDEGPFFDYNVPTFILTRAIKE